MARARNIKPGFFTNEYLVELPFEYRLLFIGLWTLADKEGRLEDRPKKIKMEVFPADNVDIVDGLKALASFGFITRYVVEGRNYIEINNWQKHQSPHHTEKASVIPPVDNGDLTVNPQKQNGGNPPDSLIPDSLIPDSVVVESDGTSSSIGRDDEAPIAPLTADGNADRAVEVALILRKSGIDATAAQLRAGNVALALAQPDADWLAAADKARRAKPNDRIGVNYLLPIMADIRANHSFLNEFKSAGPPLRQSIHERRVVTIAALTGQTQGGTNERTITGECRTIN